MKNKKKKKRKEQIQKQWRKHYKDWDPELVKQYSAEIEEEKLYDLPKEKIEELKEYFDKHVVDNNTFIQIETFKKVLDDKIKEKNQKQNK